MGCQTLLNFTLLGAGYFHMPVILFQDVVKLLENSLILLGLVRWIQI